MKILDGKKVGEEVLYSVSKRIRKEKLKITLAIILVGNNPASEIYVKNKILSCEKVGITASLHKLNNTVTEQEIITLIEKLNKDDEVHGIILQSPLPEGVDFNKCSAHISSLKDIDGLSYLNVINNYNNKKCILPCTVKGIITLLDYYNIDVMGKNICIIGRSNLVGKPLFLALENLGATVTLCHKQTKDISRLTITSDIVIMACGVPKLLKADMIKDKCVVIDVGISRVEGKIVGDCDFENIKSKCDYITPVPGGVGPMTVASVIENTLLCYERINSNG